MPGGAVRRPDGRRGRCPARRRRPVTRHPCRHRDAQPTRVPRGAVRHLARRSRGRSGQRPPPPRRDRLHPRPQRVGRRGDRRRPCRRRRVTGRHRRFAAGGGGGTRRAVGPAHGVVAGAARRPAAGGPGVAVLHERHHRTTQGSHAHAPQPAHGVAQLLRRHRPGDAAGLHPPRRAAVARFGALRAAPRRPRGGERRAGVRRRRRRRDRRPAAALAGNVVLRRSHHGEAAGRRPGRRRRRPLPPEDHHLWRRTDVPGRPGGRPRRLRPPLGPDLRAGRDADDDHRPVQGRPRGTGPSPVAGPAAERRRPPHRRRGPRRRRRRP